MAAFGIAAVVAARSVVRPLEAAVFGGINRLPDEWHPLVWPVMQLGSLAAVPACALAAFRLGFRGAATRIALAGSAAWIAAKPVKRWVARDRPACYVEGVNVRGSPQTGLGFPSGHAAVAMAMALTLARGADPRLRCAAASVAVVVAGSRVYVGAHLPLDAAGGLLLGAAVGILVRELGPT